MCQSPAGLPNTGTPSSGYGYADLEAYKELKQRLQSDRRGLTGKRTKRQSSKGLGMPPRMHRQDTDSDPAQLATGAEQGYAAVPSDTQASHATDQLLKQAQLAADAKAVDSSCSAVASNTAHAAAAAAPVTAVSSQPAAAVAPAAAGPSQSQVALTAVAPGVAGIAVDMAEAMGSASAARLGIRQPNQLSPATANAEAASPGSNVSLETADGVITHVTTCMPSVPAVSKPAAASSGNVAVHLQTALHHKQSPASSGCVARRFALLLHLAALT